LDEMEQAVRSMNGTAVQSAATAWCHRISIDQHPCGTFPTPCRMPQIIQAVLEAKGVSTQYLKYMPNGDSHYKLLYKYCIWFLSL
jgi:hypothetical protein